MSRPLILINEFEVTDDYLISLGSWSTDLQSDGVVSTPTLTLDITDDVAQYIDFTSDSVRVTIDSWTYSIDKVQAQDGKITLSLTGIIAKAIDATWTQSTPYPCDARTVASNILGSSDGIPAGYMIKPINLDHGKLVVESWDTWPETWSFSCDGIAANQIFVYGIHWINAVETAVTDSRDGHGGYCTAIASNMTARWRIQNVQTYYNSEEVADIKSDAEMTQVEKAGGSTLWSYLSEEKGYQSAELAFRAVGQVKNEFSQELTITSQKGSLSAKCSDDAPLWLTTSTPRQTVSSNVRARMHNIDSTITWTFNDVKEWCAANGAVLATDASGHTKAVTLWNNSTSAVMQLDENYVVSCKESSTSYDAYTGSKGKKLIVKGIGDGGSDETVEIALTDNQEEPEEISVSCLGSILHAVPAVFEQGTGPFAEQITGPYIQLSGRKLVYNASYYDQLTVFGNEVGVFQGTLREPLGHYPFVSGGETFARDETGAYWPDSIIDAIELPIVGAPGSTAARSQIASVTSIIKKGGFAILQGAYSAPHVSPVSSISAAWEIQVPYDDCKDLRIGDRLTLNLPYFWPKIQNSIIVGQTVDALAGIIDLRILLTGATTENAYSNNTIYSGELVRTLSANREPVLTIISGTELNLTGIASTAGNSLVKVNGSNTMPAAQILPGLFVQIDDEKYYSNEQFSGSRGTILTADNGFITSTITPGSGTIYDDNIAAGGVYAVHYTMSNSVFFLTNALAERINSGASLRVWINATAEMRYE